MTQENKTGVAEWAQHSVNIQTGCENNCRYCYAKQMAVRFKTVTPEAWAAPVLRYDNIEKRYPRYKGVVMFPTSHDITPGNIVACEAVLLKLLRAGNRVLIVSKMEVDCIDRLCKSLAPFKRQVEFRCTMGSQEFSTLDYWEPGAPGWPSRVGAMEGCLSEGYKTSLSMEPLLDHSMIDNFNFSRRLDSIWIGAMTRVSSAVMEAAPEPLPTPRYFRNLNTRYKDSKVIRFKESARRFMGMGRDSIQDSGDRSQ
jgi:DNA repair photolyase